MDNRQLQTEDFVSLAFTSPASFNDVYQQMTPDQCEAFVDAIHSRNSTFFIYKATVPQRNFIFENISTEKLLEVFLKKYNNYIPIVPIKYSVPLVKRFLSDPAVDLTFKTALGRFSTSQLAQVLFSLNNRNEIDLLHYIRFFSEDKLKEILSLFEIKKCLNEFATLQNTNNGGTYIHALLKRCQYDLVEFILNSLDNETFDKLMALEKKNDVFYEFNYTNRSARKRKNKFGLSFIANIFIYFPALIPKIHSKAMEAQEECGTTHYFDAVLAASSRYVKLHSSKRDFLLENVSERLDLIQGLIRIFNEIISHIKLPVNALTQIDKYSNAPVILNIVIIIDAMYERIHHVKYDESLAHLFPLVDEIQSAMKLALINLFEKVPAKIFYQTLEKFRFDNKYYKLSDPFDTKGIISDLHKAFNNFNYIPYLYQDPMKFFQLLNYKDGERYFHDEDLHAMQICMLDPAPAQVVNFYNQPSFCDRYQKIVTYQIGLGRNCNPQYIENLNMALTAIKTRYTKEFPEVQLYWTNCLKQIQTMIILLQNARQEIITREKALELHPSPNMSTTQLIQCADICKTAAAGLDDYDIVKSKLEIIALQFLYLTVVPYINRPALVPEEKKEDAIVSLDEENIKDRIEFEDSKVILLFNTRVHTNVVNIAYGDYAISQTEVDIDTFKRVLQHHLRNLQNLHFASHKTHLAEFTAYIQLRAAYRPFLFINTEGDYLLRKKYYDAATKNDETVDDMHNKIVTLDKAINDPKLKSGFSNRCLDLLKSLREDFETRIFLLEAGLDLKAVKLPVEIEMKSLRI